MVLGLNTVEVFLRYSPRITVWTPSTGGTYTQPSSSSFRPAALSSQLAKRSSWLGGRMKRPSAFLSVPELAVSSVKSWFAHRQRRLARK